MNNDSKSEKEEKNTEIANIEPCPLEDFARIHCEILLFDSVNQKKDEIINNVLRANNLTNKNWEEYNKYWGIRIKQEDCRNKFFNIIKTISDKSINEKIKKKI